MRQLGSGSALSAKLRVTPVAAAQDEAESVCGGANVVATTRLNELLEPSVKRLIQSPEAVDLFGVFR